MSVPTGLQAGDREPDTIDTSGVHVWLILWKATRSVEALARKSVKGLGMGNSDFGILETLLHKGPLPVNEIGKRVLLASGSMTTAIDRLQQRGFVARKDHPTDHRTWLVHLTTSGRKWIKKAFAQHAVRMDAALASLSNEEKTALVQTLKKVGKGAEALT